MTEHETQYLDYLNNLKAEVETKNEYLNRIKMQNKSKKDNKNL